MKHTYLLLILGLCYLSNLQAQTRYDDSLSLVNLYNMTNGPNWIITWDFNAPIDTWPAVSLINNRISALNLSNKNLAGNIPDLNLSNLKNLSLNHNQLSGNIPDFLNLPNLQTLNLKYNQLTGDIPNFSNLPNLIDLLLDQNQLSGNVPSFDFPSLKVLYLGGNQLSGNIPDFPNLPSLEALQISTNQLTGDIPNFSNLPNLIDLLLGQNQLSGNIPDFSNLPNLQTLNLQYNQLIGDIPNFSNLPNLYTLYLNYNQLSGIIPDFSLNPNPKHIKFENNQFTFEDIIATRANIQMNTFTFTYSPQDSICQTLIKEVLGGSSYTIELMVDDTVTSSTYTWYKNDIFYTTTSINELSFNNFQISDAGLYYCIVTNPNAPALNLVSRTKNLIFDIPLSVELLNFEGHNTSEGNLLAWQTVQEINNKGFEIQHSLNLDEWKTIGFVESNGSSEQTSEYTFLDTHPFVSINYYRLKQIDEDGSLEYSPHIAINYTNRIPELGVFPNPNEGLFTLDFGHPFEEVIVKIRNLHGQLISRETVNNRQQHKVQLKQGKGIYFIQLTTSQGVSRPIKVLID